jgi:hypothetical protein
MTDIAERLARAGVRNLVKQAIIAEIDRQVLDEKFSGPYFDPEQGIIDGIVDLDRIADAVVAALEAEIARLNGRG